MPINPAWLAQFSQDTQNYMLPILTASGGTSAAGGAAGGAASGAAGGPIGAVIGGVGTGIKGIFDAISDRQKEKQRKKEFQQQLQLQRDIATRSTAMDKYKTDRTLGLSSIEMMLAQRRQAMYDAARRSARNSLLGGSASSASVTGA